MFKRQVGGGGGGDPIICSAQWYPLTFWSVGYCLRDEHCSAPFILKHVFIYWVLEVFFFFLTQLNRVRPRTQTREQFTRRTWFAIILFLLLHLLSIAQCIFTALAQSKMSLMISALFSGYSSALITRKIMKKMSPNTIAFSHRKEHTIQRLPEEQLVLYSNITKICLKKHFYSFHSYFTLQCSIKKKKKKTAAEIKFCVWCSINMLLCSNFHQQMLFWIALPIPCQGCLKLRP